MFVLYEKIQRSKSTHIHEIETNREGVSKLRIRIYTRMVSTFSLYKPHGL